MNTREQTRWRERRNFGFTLNSESEKNERKDEVSKVCTNTCHKTDLTKKKSTSRQCTGESVKILIKIISSIQDKISLLLLLSKIVLKFINFHTHFAVRLPQQRFFFFLITVIQLINYLKLRDTISVIIFICTIYLIFFYFILLRFRKVSLRFL